MAQNTAAVSPLLRQAKGRLGQLFYQVGESAEYAAIRFGRGVRESGRFAARLLGLLLRPIGASIVRALREAAEDLTAPVRRLRSGFAHIRQAMAAERQNGAGAMLAAAGRYLVSGVRAYGYLGKNLLYYLLPLGAGAVFVLTVFVTLNQNFALAVNCNGNLIGYVSQESVYEDAARMVEGQIIYTGSEEKWNLEPSFTITTASQQQMSDSQTLVNEILTNSGAEIAQATGLYVDDKFYGATTDEEALQQAIDAIKAPYAEQYPDAEIQFVQNVQLRSGLYLNESIKPYSDLETLFTQPVEGQRTYVVQDGDTPWSIALSNNITVDELYALNPELDNGNYMVVGMQLVISQSVSFLQVQAVRTEVAQETIPYQTITTEDDELSYGKTKVTQEGVDGVQEVTYQVTYIDGQEASRVQVGDPVVISEPVDELISEGTFVSTEGMNRAPSSGGMIFPIGPGFTYQSRGFYGAYSHNGLDLCAAYGTPIYAAQSGTVVYASATAGGYGIHVEIDHGGGVHTLYGHCSALAVSYGQYVTQGQVIAYVGSTGNSTGNHCHFEVIVNGSRVNPAPYIGFYG